MYLVVKTAQRKTKNHHGASFSEVEYINRGEKYLQLNNGTIGAGARAVNIGKTAAIEMLKKTLEELTVKDLRCEECNDLNFVFDETEPWECGECGRVNPAMKDEEE